MRFSFGEVEESAAGKVLSRFVDWNVWLVGLLVCFSWISPAASGAYIEVPTPDRSIHAAGAEVNRSIARTQQMGEVLVARSDQAAKQRLAQLDGIVQAAIRDLAQLEQDAVEDIQAILDRLKADLAEIEESLFQQVRQALWDAECAANRVLIEELRTVLGTAGKILGSHRVEIDLPIEDSRWWCFTCRNKQVFEIKVPSGDTYIEIRDAMLGNLEERLEDETPAHAIVGTYEFLSALALKTSCFYPGSTERWINEHLAFKAKASMWKELVSVEIKK